MSFISKIQAQSKEDFLKYKKQVKIGNKVAGYAKIEFRVPEQEQDLCFIYAKDLVKTEGYGEIDKKQVSALIKALQGCLDKM